MPRLSIDRLRVSRGDRVLIPALSFDLGGGELLHLRGANGCGKTSLLEMLAGLRRVEDGAVTGEPEALPRHWIGHRNALSLHLSATENLRYWCGLNDVDDAVVGPALARLAVPRGAQRREVRTLSAGQKRRSALARLLLQQRPLWLLDEPLDGLDRAGIDLFCGLLEEHLAGDGMVLMTSHQPLPAGLRGVRELQLDAEQAS